MRIGVRLPQYGSTWPELRDAALRAERLGFDGLWLNDHLQSPGRLKAESTFEVFTTLAALAPMTTARLGTVVLSASYRPAPLAAKMASVLDTIAGGRLVVGIGTGSDRAEHRAYGIPFPDPAARTAGLRETLAVFRAMAGMPEGATVDGSIANAPNVPASAPPIWLAAHKPGLLRLAGREADGIIAAFLTPDELARRRAVAEEARDAVGRPEMACCLYTFALPVSPETEAWLGPEAEALGTNPATVLRWLGTTGIVAPADELSDRLAEYARAGTTDAVLALPSRVPPEAWDALAEAVLPADGHR